jgi:integrase
MSDSKIARLAPSGNTEINARDILCERGGRRRTGSLTLRKRAGKMTWCAQVTVDADAGPKRVLYSLDTDDRTIAKRKLRKLVSRLDGEREVRRDDAGAAETVSDYFAAWLERRRAEGYDVRDDERSIRAWAIPDLGHLPLVDVRAHHLRPVLVAVVEAGKARNTVKNVRGALQRLFKAAWREELIRENPMDRVETPRMPDAPVVKPRALPTDAEFAAFLSFDGASLEGKLTALVARTLGGMRASDVNALTWSDFTDDFSSVIVPRTKTKRPQRLTVPAAVRAHLRAWHEHEGSPSVGPVFPVRRGERAGEHKSRRGTSYAARFRRDLRLALEAAGLPIREELFVETDTSLPTDFHNMRRMFAGGLAAAGVGLQQAAALTGHSSEQVHNLYASHDPRLREVPLAALPSIPAPNATDGFVSVGARLAKLAQVAEEKGFEPSDGLRRRRFSKPLP